jgi:hypothetical protein
VTDRERHGLDADDAIADLAGSGAIVLASIWATVDLGRRLDGPGLPLPTAEPSDDPLLGAWVVVMAPDAEGSRLAIAEPNTEGRLAATLARHGEGLAGRYVAVADGLAIARSRAADAGIAVSRVEEGPFGPSMLVLIGPVSGPHLILCDPAAVPSKP